MDLDDVLRSNHLSERDAAVIKLQEKATKSFRADVVGLLGEHAFQIFTNYERALPVRELVNKLAGAVAFEGQPLTEPQATQLTETLVVSSPPYRDGGTADTNTIDWPAVIAESPKILTPPQQASFLNMAPVYRVDNDTLETPDP
jgi:hypothetical protein